MTAARKRTPRTLRRTRQQRGGETHDAMFDELERLHELQKRAMRDIAEVDRSLHELRNTLAAMKRWRGL